jgi:hypothetical protein
MSENVIGLHATYVPPRTKAKPNREVIEELERLLDQAKAGEIVGLAGSFLHRDKVVSFAYAGMVAGFGMIGGLECLKETLLRKVLNRG